ncbi:MAG: CapA family protein [Bacillota bacterium]
MSSRTFTFACAGDAIITKRVSQITAPAFLDMVDLIRSADAAFVNLEVVTPRPPLIPSAEHGGANLGVPEFVLDELKWMGFNLFNVANNHSNDFTFHGIVDTMNALAERGLVFAGGGMNLGEARSPGYLDTDDVRVAVLGAASSFVVGAPAGPSRMDMPGRPGISPLRVDYEYVLDEKQWAALEGIEEALGLAQVRLERSRQPEQPLTFLGQRFVRGDKSGIREKVNEKDMEDICRWIYDARRQAEFVVMSLHAHQGKNRRGNCPDLADFLPDVAHRFIDAGADVVVGHGPHMLRGIEIYKGKPIFYSLGDFYYVSSGIRRYPAEIYERHGLPGTATPADVQDRSNMDEQGNPRGFAADERFWQSVIPMCRYEWVGSEDGASLHGSAKSPQLVLTSLELHPIDLNYRARHRTHRGEPELADPQTGTDILQQLQALSQPFGVEIAIEPNGKSYVVGKVKLP